MAQLPADRPRSPRRPPAARVDGPAPAAGDPAPVAPRTPAEVRRDGNALRHETSLYLRQHAHNPVEWLPWGEAALARARDEDKPIFLSIGYASCHWCHVMEREVFEHDDVAELLNRHFVSVKVDREERPDLDAVYMDAVQALTGGGGWPLSAFLTADGRPFFGGTYFPRDRFLALCEQVRRLHAERRDDLLAQAAALAAHVAAWPSWAQGEAGPLAAEAVDEAAARAAASFDRRWGGTDSAMKFPMPTRWRFLLHHHRKTGDAKTARPVELTLAAMASGGIYDHVGGGFHRYTVEATWLIPHFEKMLYDNALLASLYLEAGAALGRPEFTAVGRDTLDFLIDEMSGEEGGFYASYDADSDGEEGAYYVWDPDDLALAVGDEDAEALARLLGVTEEGNFEGRSVVTRRADLAAVAADLDWDPAELAHLFNRLRPALREYRDRRARPALDTKIVTAWNGLALSALVHGYQTTGEERYRVAAERAADWLEQAHRAPDGGLLRATNDGAPAGAAILDDYAAVACGLLDLYQATGETARLRRALELIHLARARFADPRGGFLLTAADTEAPLGRKGEHFDGATPCGQSLLLHALLHAAALTGREELRADVERAVARHAPLLRPAGLEMAWWLDAALLLRGPTYEVVIAGDEDDRATAALAAAALRTMPPQATVARVPAAGADAELARLAPTVAGKAGAGGRARAFVCEWGSCRAPASEPEVVVEQIGVGWVC